MLRTILILLVVAIGGFAAYVASLPPKFTVERSITVSAAPETVFPHVNNFKKWDAWSPWAKKDPNAKAVYEGPEAGKGAVFKWSGNDEVGEGQMTIVKSTPNERVDIDLTFVKPFPGSSDVAMVLKPEGSGTNVTWSISGEQPFLERAIMVAMRMDVEQMIGTEYEKGLATLKTIVEAEPPPAPTAEATTPAETAEPAPTPAATTQPQ